MPTIWDWSTTAGNNATADADINWSEGQFPSTVNDSARQMMGRQAEWLKDNGVLTAAGTANAIAVVANSQVTTPPHGMTIAFRAAAANTGAATLSINGGSGLPLRKPKPGSASVADLEANDLTQGGVFIVHYDSAANEGVGSWVLINPTANQAAIGAALAAATAKTSPDDADFISGVQSGGTALFKITWANVRAWIKGWIVKADVGLGNVDNTSDANKPVSTATQNALDGKLNLSGGVLTGSLRTSSTFEVRAVIPKIYMISPGAVIGYRMEANISDTVDGGWRVANGYAGGAILEAFSSGRINISGWLEVNGMGNVKTYVDSQSYSRTKDYLLAETLTVGGYAFAMKASAGTIQPYSTVAGTDLNLTGTASTVGGIGFGTWQVIGSTLSNSNGTLVKRIA